MAAPELDVVTIGNAIVDVIDATAEERLLAAHGLVKGTMTLLDAAQAEAVYASMGPSVQVSGGSAANTAVGVAAFGGRAAFIGKVADDLLGAAFTHDIRAAGVAFTTPPLGDGAGTGRCLVLVTPDAQRTMGTYLGASTRLAPEDIDEDMVARCQITYLEGYMWDPPEAIAALRRAIAVAHAARRRLAFTLSDPFCVDRHREGFLELVDREVDVLFANEAEVVSLFEAPSFEVAAAEAGRLCELAVLTRGPRGSLVLAGGEALHVPAAPSDVVDTTGAGDLYAAGFLFGLAVGADVGDCARLGALAAAEVISHVGARPMASLESLAAPVLDPTSG